MWIIVFCELAVCSERWNRLLVAEETGGIKHFLALKWKQRRLPPSYAGRGGTHRGPTKTRSLNMRLYAITTSVLEKRACVSTVCVCVSLLASLGVVTHTIVLRCKGGGGDWLGGDFCGAHSTTGQRVKCHSHTPTRRHTHTSTNSGAIESDVQRRRHWRGFLSFTHTHKHKVSDTFAVNGSWKERVTTQAAGDLWPTSFNFSVILSDCTNCIGVITSAGGSSMNQIIMKKHFILYF